MSSNSLLSLYKQYKDLSSISIGEYSNFSCLIFLFIIFNKFSLKSSDSSQISSNHSLTSSIAEFCLSVAFNSVLQPYFELSPKPLFEKLLEPIMA